MNLDATTPCFCAMWSTAHITHSAFSTQAWQRPFPSPTAARGRQAAQAARRNLGITYTANELDTGDKWIDGKAIYQKILTVGAKKANDQSVATGVTGLYQMLDMRGMLYASTSYSGYAFVVPAWCPKTQNVNYQSALNTTARVTSCTIAVTSLRHGIVRTDVHAAMHGVVPSSKYMGPNRSEYCNGGTSVRV